MVFINEMYLNANNEKYLRIIEIDSVNDTLYYVDICFKNNINLPETYKLSVFIDEIEKGLYVKIPDLLFKIIDETTINQRDIDRRDELWQIVNKYWTENKDELLIKSKRSKLFELISKEYEISNTSIKRHFSRFFERGMCKNSLLSQYSHCGGKGKERMLGSVKTGRPITYKNGNKGINITNEIKKIFLTYLEKYHYKGNWSIYKVYRKIIDDCFSYKYEKNGEIKSDPFEEGTYPTCEQFYYFCAKYNNNILNRKKIIIDKQGERDYQSNYRPTLSNSKSETIGPGTRYQIDATLADLHLASEFDRERTTGRPVVYIIIDVFSRMIVGIYAGFGGPSWMDAMMALDNMVSNKVDYCKEYGIDINEKQWPSHHLPRMILADRGEFEGYSPENLINNIGVFIENTAPYSGQDKGIVERIFGTMNTKIKETLPGAIVKEYKLRGDIDYRLQAALTLKEFTKWLIIFALEHNNTAITGYPMEIGMINDGIVPMPTQLWEWGIQNKKGHLSIINRDILRLNLLPKAEAYISRSGVKFNGRGYSSQKAIEENWFVDNNKPINIIYDPRNIGFIYIPNVDGKSFEKLYLLDIYSEYKDSFVEEILFLQNLQNEILKDNKHNDLKVKIDSDRLFDQVIKNAVKEKKNNIPLEQKSKTAKIKRIGKNRQFEKDMNREKEKFELDEEKEIDTLSNIPTKDESIECDLEVTGNEDDEIYNLILEVGNEKIRS